jgi:bifunctional ADP-heptose synthase (sugar kinase/adenylyltransferase)
LRVTALIERLRPHLFAKGGDYSRETMDGEEHAALVACGAEIHFLSNVKGKSTSGLISRMRHVDSPPYPLASETLSLKPF